jgi:predicted TIM-barrel fold metal-dependent hydrolase
MIFDTAAHPTLDGTWLSGRSGQTFSRLKDLATAASVRGVCAIGLPGVGGYRHDLFYRSSMENGFFPVAALTQLDPIEIGKELDIISNLGFSAVKVHPRLLGINRASEIIPEIMRQIADHSLTCFLCTYYHDEPGNLPESDPYWAIAQGLNLAPEIKLVLLHGGGSRVIEYSQFCRYSSSILLDVSFTMMKFRTSSISQDIAFLLRDLDQRLCIGSDGPEWSYDQVLPFIAELTGVLSPEKRENVLWKNISRLLDLDTQ